MWLSIWQTTVESSTFGSELVAARIAKAFCLELRMMGVEVIGAISMFCANDSVVTQVTLLPESALKVKHHLILYYLVREAQAAHIISVAKENGKTNMSDICTKLIPGPILRELIGYILW